MQLSAQETETFRVQAATDLSALEAKLQGSCFKIRNVPSDGNCFFWAASDQLDRLGLDHHTQQQLRDRTALYLDCLPQVLI